MQDKLYFHNIKITDIYLHVVNKQQKWVMRVVTPYLELQTR
jgi:hypothetical protein